MYVARLQISSPSRPKRAVIVAEIPLISINVSTEENYGEENQKAGWGERKRLNSVSIAGRNSDSVHSLCTYEICGSLCRIVHAPQ